MFGNLEGMFAKLEQYQTIMRVVNTWDMLRNPVIIAGIVCLLLSIFLFMRRKCGRVFFLILAILLGLTTVGMDKFKAYVEERKKEAVKEAITEAVTSLPEKIAELPESAGKAVTETVKKILPFGGK